MKHVDCLLPCGIDMFTLNRNPNGSYTLETLADNCEETRKEIQVGANNRSAANPDNSRKISSGVPD